MIPGCRQLLERWWFQVQDQRRRGDDARRCANNLQALLELDQLGDAIVHLLDGIEFGETHATLVGDVVDTALSLGVLAAGAAHLQVVLGGDLLQLGLVGGQLGDLDVHRGADGGAQVGGAEGQEAETVIVAEGHTLLDLVDGSHQTLVDLAQVTALLHGDDAEVILLVAPDQEGLGIIVVDATTAGPVAASVGGLQEAIALLEQEVVVDQLLLDGLLHASQRVELALKLALESGEGGANLGLHLLVLGLGQAGVERVSLHGAAATHASGDHVLVGGINVTEGGNISEVGGRVLVGLLEATMVVLDDGVEQVGEHCVGLGIGGVDAHTGVVVLQARLDNIQQGRLEGGGHLVLQVVEDLLGQVLLQQRLGVGGSQLGITLLQFSENSGINHGVLFAAKTERREHGGLTISKRAWHIQVLFLAFVFFF